MLLAFLAACSDAPSAPRLTVPLDTVQGIVSGFATRLRRGDMRRGAGERHPDQLDLRARPPAWRLAMPDFTGVPQFPAVVAPKPGTLYWTLMLSGRPGRMFRNGPPTDGQVARTALSTGPP